MVTQASRTQSIFSIRNHWRWFWLHIYKVCKRFETRSGDRRVTLWRLRRFAWKKYSTALAAMGLLLLAFPNAMRAQSAIATRPLTVTQVVWTNANCSSTLDSGNLQNGGQLGHSFNYSVTNPGPSFQVEIQGSADGTTWFQISNDAQAQPGIIVGVGAYPFLRVSAIGGGAGCTISGTYIGSAAATTVNVAASNAQFMYQRNALINLSAGSNQSATGIVPPYGNANGFLVFSYLGAAGPSGSTLSVTANDSLTGTTITVATLSLATTADTAQVLDVPNFSASNLTVSYTSGGASSATVSAAYYFTYPGQGPNGSSTPTSVDVVAPNPLPVSFTPSGADPCLSSAAAKTSAPINIGTGGATVQIVAPSTGKVVYVCSVSLALSGGGQTVTATFEAGTGGSCGTGTTDLTGPLTSNNSNEIFALAGSSVLVAPSGDGVCVAATGTYGVALGGSISYVQQ